MFLEYCLTGLAILIAAVGLGNKGVRGALYSSLMALYRALFIFR